MKKISSIKSKLLKGIIIPMVVLLLIAVIIISFIVSHSIDILQTEKLSAESSSASYEISEYFTKYLEIATQLSLNTQVQNLFEHTAKGKKITETEGYKEAMDTLSQAHNSDSENVQVCWLADMDSSQCVEDTGYVSEMGKWDITTRDWYKQVMEEKKTVITEPYENSSTGALVSSVIAPVFSQKDDSIIGVAALDLSVDTLKSMMSVRKIGQSGYFTLITKQGLIIYHPEEKNIGKNVTEASVSDNLKEAIGKQKTGAIVYSSGGNRNIHGSLSTIGGTGWIAVSALPDKEYNSSIRECIIANAIVFIICIAILIIILLKIGKGIVKPLIKLKEVASGIAQGNLDVQLDTSGNDEVGEVARAFDLTVQRLKNYINYINEISGVLEHIANGQLKFELKQDYQGEFEKIKIALLHIRDTLTETITKIRETSVQVSGGAGQISEGAQSLAEGATDQASSVEELQATITELVDHIENNSANALEADKKAKQVGEDIKSSNEEMQNIVKAMDLISQSTNQISDIISTIEDIAGQTNLLSLNASIEAARAGEAGKGFAVVAGEVGNLAMDSEKATQTSTTLIENTTLAVKDGIRIVNKAAEELSGTVAKIMELGKTIDDISNASEIQAEQLSQVKDAVEQISSIVSNNSAMAQESAAASEELNAQSQLLNSMIGKFEL